jgi:hypothetical protein
MQVWKCRLGSPSSRLKEVPVSGKTLCFSEKEGNSLNLSKYTCLMGDKKNSLIKTFWFSSLKKIEFHILHQPVTVGACALKPDRYATRLVRRSEKLTHETGGGLRNFSVKIWHSHSWDVEDSELLGRAAASLYISRRFDSTSCFKNSGNTNVTSWHIPKYF